MEKKLNWFYRLVLRFVHRKQLQVLDDVRPGAQGRPVADVRAELVAAAAKRRCNFPDDLLDQWAGALSRGEEPELFTPDF